MCVLLCLLFFFFQAEDGIRYLVRSRGLGDVYKRQEQGQHNAGQDQDDLQRQDRPGHQGHNSHAENPNPVSYTHLTLPTSDLV